MSSCRSKTNLDWGQQSKHKVQAWLFFVYEVIWNKKFLLGFVKTVFLVKNVRFHVKSWSHLQFQNDWIKNDRFGIKLKMFQSLKRLQQP